MQAVSNYWKAAHTEQLVPESFVEVRLAVSEPGLQADGTATDNGHSSISLTNQIVGDEDVDPPRHTTLERNLWMLDGDSVSIPDDAPVGDMGYISEVFSNADGVFEDHPIITISFPGVWNALIPGISIMWGTAYDYEYAEDFYVRAYNGSSVVAEAHVTDNASEESVIWVDIQNFDRVTVEVVRWHLPGRRARVAKILVGITRKYEKTDIFSFTNSQSVSPLSASLPKAEVSFTVSNLNGEYNPDNTTGFAKYLTERQSVSVRYGYKVNGAVEWISGGIYYLSEWETPQNGIQTTFTARDMLEFMTDPYSGPKSGTLYDMALAALEQSNLPLREDGSVRWVIDSSLADIVSVDLSEDSDYTAAEILQMCANAACCVLYQDRQGTLHIEPLASGITDYEVTPFVSYQYADMSLSKQIKAVNVNNGQYTLTIGTVGETQSVSNPLITDARAPEVAAWIAGYLVNRKTLNGSFRADPRLDALDRITNVNKYATNTVLVTDVEYTYNGAFRGTYEGRAEA